MDPSQRPSDLVPLLCPYPKVLSHLLVPTTSAVLSHFSFMTGSSHDFTTLGVCLRALTVLCNHERPIFACASLMPFLRRDHNSLSFQNFSRGLLTETHNRVFILGHWLLIHITTSALPPSPRTSSEHWTSPVRFSELSLPILGCDVERVNLLVRQKYYVFRSGAWRLNKISHA